MSSVTVECFLYIDPEGMVTYAIDPFEADLLDALKPVLERVFANL